MSPHSAKARNVGGRPLLPKKTDLFVQCDAWIQLLSQAWGEVGWPLLTARDEKDIRDAFARVRHPSPPEEPLLRPFRQTPITRVTTKELRQTQQALQTLREELGLCIYDGDGRPKLPMLTQAMGESKRALREASLSRDENYESIRQAHLQRVSVLFPHKRERTTLQQKVDALDAKVRDQEAAYTQQELLAFIRAGKYRFTIRNVACALAGLPFIGASQSHRRCAKHEEIFWPTWQSLIFDLIDRAWRNRTERSPERFQLELQKQICRMRTRENEEHDNGQARFARQHLIDRWRYLKLATQNADLTTTQPRSVPFVVLGEFLRRSHEAVSEKERVQAAQEILDCGKPIVRRRRSLR